MVIFTKKFRTLDPHLPIVWDKVLKNGCFYSFPKYLVLLEGIEHGNSKEKRVGRPKMKAAITSSEHVSQVGRGKSRTCVTSICIYCASPDFSSSWIQNPLYVIMIMYC